MKPKNKHQQLVYGLSTQLPTLHEKLKPWAFDTCVKHIGYRTKKATSCLSCGHVWKGSATSKEDDCPACKRRLTIEDTMKKKNDQLQYFSVFDVMAGFQVIRFFRLQTWHKAGTEPSISCTEVIQMWLNPDGKNEVVARNCGGFGVYSSDHFYGELEIRDRTTMGWKYNYYSSVVYPKSKFLPVYKLNGFNKNFHGITPYDLFTKLTEDSKVETLLKAKQYSLLKARVSSRPDDVLKYWNSVKVCIRNNYVVKDAITWLDYLDLLQYFRKDLRNHKYVCPTSLKKEHNRYVARKRKIDQRIEAERERERREQDDQRKRRLEENKVNALSADQLQYIDEKSQYFGLEFTESDLTIKVLESVQEFFQESEAHKHCVYTNEYFKKKDTLVFSAQINGVRTETVEVKIDTLEILQSRGLDNIATEHNERIIKLMKKNLHQIRKRSKGVQMEVAA